MNNQILVTRSSMPDYEEYCEEIKELWDSHWLTNMGKKHKQLQAELETMLDVPHVTLYVNGHLALENENAEDNVLNSGVDLLFAVMKESKHKDEVYKVLDFMYQDDTIQIYLDNQSAVPCKEGDFILPSILDSMKEDIDSDNMSDFHDHHYPSEMSVDAMIQTYLMDDSADATDKFLSKFDKDWKRYNRDLIEKVQKYEKEGK